MIYDDLIYLTENEMSKNIIWILVIGFVLGFISREQWNTESWEFVFLAMQGIGSILVPVMIFWWANRDQKRRDERELERIKRDKKELKRKEDKEYIQAYIEKHLEHLIVNDPSKIKEEEEKYKTDIKNYLITSCNTLTRLIHTINISSYSYMVEYLNLLKNLTLTIVQHSRLSKFDLFICYTGFSINIHYIEYLLLLDKNLYQKEVLRTAYSFIGIKGKVRDLTLKFFKKYPLYEKSAQELINKLEQEEATRRLNIWYNTMRLKAWYETMRKLKNKTL